MARGLVVSSHAKTTSNLILTSIARVSSPIHSGKSPFSSNRHLRFSPTNSSCSSTRFLCGSSSRRDDGPIDISKYREAFAKRMAMAGLKPHHRIALGVSGGPDSMALCVLAASWKTNGSNAAGGQGRGFIDGLLAIVIDHGLRAESKEEANTVSHRVLSLGIRCEIAHCEWSDGRPKKGHLQEAARNRRYQNFQNVCMQHQIGVLLIAHHADDQAELFILRLSRNSGVLGLAGMAFVSELYSTDPNSNDETLNDHGILLVRPLLEFSKEDMYKICLGAKQEWVEDPTNQSPLFARNRIRMALKKLSSSFNSDLQAVISSCRRTRLYIDRICYNLINQSVTIMAQGYAVINLNSLNPSKLEDIYLCRFMALVLQFISQRHRPVRGSALKLLLDYFRSSPCKTSFTAAGCYLCPAPGSKGTKVLVCCSVDSSLPLKMEVFHKLSYEGQGHYFPLEVAQIISDGKSYVDSLIMDASDIQFLDVRSYESVLVEARRLEIISESTFRSILSLQKDETEHFRSKNEKMPDYEFKNEGEPASSSMSKELEPGCIGYFMNRFLVKWEPTERIALGGGSLDEATGHLDLGGGSQHLYCESCLVGHDKGVNVRHMIDADWLYLAKLSEYHLDESKKQRILFTDKKEQMMGKKNLCSDYARLYAYRALQLLKSIPVAARRGLPVLVNSQGQLLSIPSVGFKHCPCLMISATFKPQVPLGGGYSSFI